MKVSMNQPLRASRGTPVKIGNVYANYTSRVYAVVVAIVEREPGRSRPYNNVICLRVDARGSIVGCEKVPEIYCQEHRDLVGRSEDLPDFSVQWLEESPGEPDRKTRVRRKAA